MIVKFYEDVDDSLLRFAVIISKSNGKWVFCKQKERDTLEIPGGHREINESILEAAHRELEEETGAKDYTIQPLFVYSATGRTRAIQSDEEVFGMVYYADITSFHDSIESEIEKIVLMDEMPKDWTYPTIQPLLIEEYLRRLK